MNRFLFIVVFPLILLPGYTYDESGVPEQGLLDVMISVFDPGLPEGDENAKEDKGVFAWVRRSEARTIPVELMETLQATGRWGMVRIVPGNHAYSEVKVTGKIRYASGFRIFLSIRAVDATGKLWLAGSYRSKADPKVFGGGKDGSPYQILYDRIARDLGNALQNQSAKHLERIRRVSRLRFAAELAPEVFEPYLKIRKRGKRTVYRVARLPAENDPFFDRVLEMQDRDKMFLDTLTNWYKVYRVRAEPYYTEWLWQSRYEEMNRFRGGRLASLPSPPKVDSPKIGSRDMYWMPRNVVSHDGLIRRWEIEKQALANLKDLARALSVQMEPMQIELEGRTVKLIGTAEARYAAWRKLLTEMFYLQTGLEPVP
ncbi:MAG: hypothetical protein QNK37_33565 [Acidobacteriota bacterium]|nr:hypothetical protein [Acidobacteriota bacterium]